MKAELATTATGRIDKPQNANALERLRQARKLLGTATAEDAYAVQGMAEGMATAARAQRAEELAREAVETRVRAERRLGELMANSGELHLLLGVTLARATLWLELARIPARLFEAELRVAVRSDRQCRAEQFIRSVRASSARHVEHGIAVTWDDWYIVKSRAGAGGRGRIVRTLEEARDLWAGGRGVAREIDELGSRARKLAQSLSAISDDVRSAKARDLLASAELKTMEAAELIHRAWVESKL